MDTATAVKEAELNLLDFGSEVTMCGVVFAGKGRTVVVPFPHEDPIDLMRTSVHELDADGFAALLNQLDVVNVEMSNKAMVRKSQRRIDSAITWAVYQRDDFRCRYCHERRPLTVDHVDLWEDGGVSVPANLVTACGPCNRARGRTVYSEWIQSAGYRKRSGNLPESVHRLNVRLIETLPFLRTLRQEQQRSR